MKRDIYIGKHARAHLVGVRARHSYRCGEIYVCRHIGIYGVLAYISKYASTRARIGVRPYARVRACVRTQILPISNHTAPICQDLYICIYYLALTSGCERGSSRAE